MRKRIGAMGLFLTAGLALSQTPGSSNTSRENMVVERGQSRARVWAGREQRPPAFDTIHGILVDDGCLNRTMANLRRTPEENPAGAGASPSNPDAERAGAMAHHVMDHGARQPDSSCGVTGQTSGFGVLLDNGSYIVLDEGGNTKASQALQANPAGRAMLNGASPAIKPRVTVRAAVRGSRAAVDNIKLD